MFAARRSVAWRRASLRYFRPLDRKLVQREPQYGIPMRAELPPRFHAKGIFHGDDLYLREPGCNLGPHSLFSPELTSSPPWRILFVFFPLLFLRATGSSLPPFRVIRVGKLRWRISVRCTVLYHVDCFMGGESRRICFNFLPFLRKYMIIVISIFPFYNTLIFSNEAASFLRKTWRRYRWPVFRISPSTRE